MTFLGSRSSIVAAGSAARAILSTRATVTIIRGRNGLLWPEHSPGATSPLAFTVDADIPTLSVPACPCRDDGFDAHRKDPLGGLDFDDEDFAWVTRELMEATAPSTGGRVVSVLEGGYSLEGLASGSVAHVRALRGN